MRTILIAAACLAAVVYSSPAQNAAAPETAPPAETPTTTEAPMTTEPGASDLPSLDDLKARLEKAQGAVNPDDPSTQALVDTYAEAVALLEAKAKQEAQASKFAGDLESAPAATEEATAELEATPVITIDPESTDPPDGLEAGATAGEINTSLVAAKQELLTEKNQLDDLDKRIVAQQLRPDQVREEAAKVGKTVSAAESAIADPSAGADSPELERAALTLAKIKVVAGKAEISMLEQEQLSYNARLALLKAQRALVARKLANAEAAVQAIQTFAEHRRDRDVFEVEWIASQAVSNARGKHPTVVELADSLKSVADRFKKIASGSVVVAGKKEQVYDPAEAERFKKALETLTRDFERIKVQISIGGMKEAQGEILVEQWRRLPSVRAERAKLANMRDRIAGVRLADYEVQEKLRDEPATIAERTLAESGEALEGEEKDKVIAELTALAEQRADLLRRLRTEYRRILTELNDLDVSQRQYVEKVEEVGVFLTEKILWVRSSEPMDFSRLKQFPESLRWMAGPHRWEELWKSLLQIGRDRPWLTGLTIAVFFLLLAVRRRCKRLLGEWYHLVRKISTDRYIYTFRALLVTIVMAAPYAMLPVLAGWQLEGFEGGSDWLRGMAIGLQWSGYLLFVLFFVRALCRGQGLADGHFRWNPQPMKSLRENVTWISLVYVPALIVVGMALEEKEPVHLAGIGRITFIVTMLWLAFFLRRMLDRETGVASGLIKTHSDRFAARLQPLWAFLVIGFPVALAVLAAMGYTMTGIVLIRQFRISLEIVGLGVLGYAMILRWFTISERRLLLEQRLKGRRERAEAAAAEAVAQGAETASGDEGGLAEFDEDTIDFEAVGEQTRRLLRFAAAGVVAIGIWFSWIELIPALRALDGIYVLGSISLAQLLPALLFLFLTVICAKNLPGILEIAVLRHLPLDAGLRYAITTLCQYTVVAIGFFLIVGALGLDWSKLGWLAAALSVGLGFGLQEIVANFVCGIILLFERPIRVGDVVTVAGTSGTVSRIRIRATTITNWERQELIVPNKEFVTGQLLNWTLSSTLNRLVLVVGVAYGSDTRRAREIILEVCHAHPEILDDPATSVVFDGFGDSTLNFTIRTYLPNMDNRLGTTHDLHTEINRRFNEEGIEIAFPQRDLHLRSIDPSIQIGPKKD